MPANIERDLYSLYEAAIRLHIDQAALRQMIFNREIRVVPRGKRLFVPRTEIQRYIDENLCEYDPDADPLPLRKRKKIDHVK